MMIGIHYFQVKEFISNFKIQIKKKTLKHFFSPPPKTRWVFFAPPPNSRQISPFYLTIPGQNFFAPPQNASRFFLAPLPSSSTTLVMRY